VVNYSSNNVTVIDGNNNHETTTVPVGDSPTAIAINPQTNQIYVANRNSDNVTVITPLEVTHPNPLPVDISSLPNDTASLSTPTFLFKAVDNIVQIYYQTPTDIDKSWQRTTLTDSGRQGTTLPLPLGIHVIRAFATNEIMEATLNNAIGTNSPFIGEISYYLFRVVPSPIALNNRGNPRPTEINEDIDPTKNRGL
jgi:YVTN family beta-propeller protein